MNVAIPPTAQPALFNPHEAPESERKARAGEIYLEAVAAAAGYSVWTSRTDLDCIDMEVKSNTGKADALSFQVKCTSHASIRQHDLSFPVDIRTYDRLRRATTIPRLLLVVVAPLHFGDWFRVNERRLNLRRCGYWLSLRGMPNTPNATGLTLRIPRSNLLTPTSLHALLVAGNPQSNATIVSEEAEA